MNALGALGEGEKGGPLVALAGLWWRMRRAFRILLGILLLAAGVALGFFLAPLARAGGPEAALPLAVTPGAAIPPSGGALPPSPPPTRVRVRWGYTHVILARLAPYPGHPGEKERILLYVRRPYLAVGEGGEASPVMSARALRVLLTWTHEALRGGPFKAEGARVVRTAHVVRRIFEDGTARITLRIDRPAPPMP